MLFLAMSRYLLMQAAATNGCDPNEVDRKGAVLSVAAYVTRLFLQADMDDLLEALHALFKRMARHRYRKREGRSFPRRSFKPTSKWGAQGRRGA